MVEKISRSEQKRLYKQVEDIARELIVLSDSDLKKLPAEEEVKAEIIECRGLKAGARKRQIKYLAKVMRQYPLDNILNYLKAKKGSTLKQNQLFHEAERWRDVIINEAMEYSEHCRKEHLDFEPDFPSHLLVELMRELPGLNEGDLRRCAYQYVRTHNKTHYRELFRMIKAAIDLEERKNRID